MRFAPDPAMSSCSGPVLYDSSTTQEILIQYMPVQGMQQVNGVGPACYNSIQDLKFIVQGDISSRIRFDKSYIKMEYVGADVSVPAPYAEVDVDHCSIPWNPIAACIQNTFYQLNGTSQTVERYDANFQHGNMIKLLMTYTRPALEDAHDRFFTPCIEETRDLVSQLSTTSLDRAKRAFQLDVSHTVQYGSKIIMLSDIFDSMRVEAAWYTQLFQLYMTFKSPDDILIHDTAVTGLPKFYVVGLKLYIVQDKLSTKQLEEETARIQTDEQIPIMRNGYRRYDVFTDVHGSTKSYFTTGIKNLQASVLMFSSTNCGDGFGANPYQYTYASSPTPDTGISFYRNRYGAITYPISGQPVDPVNKSKNTEIYSHWRTLTRLINDKMYSPTIPFYPCMAVHAAAKDVCNYVFFSAIFCNQDTAPMKTVSGYDHEIMTNGGTNGAIGIIVRIRLNALEILGDTSVHVMD